MLSTVCTTVLYIVFLGEIFEAVYSTVGFDGFERKKTGLLTGITLSLSNVDIL